MGSGSDSSSSSDSNFCNLIAVLSNLKKLIENVPAMESLYKDCKFTMFIIYEINKDG